jgi:histidinol phosphatase-like enzyme (inositol monophosphatase family)
LSTADLRGPAHRAEFAGPLDRITMSETSSLLHAALEAAQLGGRIALAKWRAGILTEWKADGSPVTAADRAAEQAIRDWVAERFPGDGVLGEEMGETPGTTGRRWVIDPIDGTKVFVAGVPLWGSLVAVMEGDRVLAGAAAYPAVHESLAAAPGEGCWHNGSRASVSRVGELAKATVLTTDLSGFASEARRAGWDALARRARQSRTWGDCYGYLLVATGRAEAMLDPVMNLWDSACLQPIIEEAGGRFTSWEGVETANGGSAVATNALLADDVRRILATP